jgi:GDP-L-fucose synthase
MRIYIAGINGMVGSSVAIEARSQGHTVLGKSSKFLDFRNRDAVLTEMKSESPDALIIAAAKVGGIGANLANPVEFLSENLQIQTNLIDAAHISQIKKVIFLGSSTVYPKISNQPIVESAIMTGVLDGAVESYGIAKIAGIRLIQSYRLQYGWDWTSVVLSNLYGPGDNFESASANVLPGLMARMHSAKTSNASNVTIWGDGTPLREFLYVEDLARAIMVLLESKSLPALLNVGSSSEISISDLSKILVDTVQFKGDISFDTDRPNGTPRKLLDSSLIRAFGWNPRVNLEDGIRFTYEWFIQSEKAAISL